MRLMEGSVKAGDTIKMMNTGKKFVVTELGYMGPGVLNPSAGLIAGEVGYIAASIKNVRDAHVGDTITLADNPTDKPLPGYRKANPMVSAVFILRRSEVQ